MQENTPPGYSDKNDWNLFVEIVERGFDAWGDLKAEQMLYWNFLLTHYYAKMLREQHHDSSNTTATKGLNEREQSEFQYLNRRKGETLQEILKEKL